MNNEPNELIEALREQVAMLRELIEYTLADTIIRDLGLRDVLERGERAILAQAEDTKPAHLQYWDTLTPDVREKWRRLSISSELSAAELAYTNRVR